MVSQPRLNTFQPVNQVAGGNPNAQTGRAGHPFDHRHNVGPSTPARLAVESDRRIEALKAQPARHSISSHAPIQQYVPQLQPQLQLQPQTHLLQQRPQANAASSRNQAIGSKTNIRIFEDEPNSFNKPPNIGSQTPNSNLLRRSDNVSSTADLSLRNGLPPRHQQPPQQHHFTPLTPPRSPLHEKAHTPTLRNPPNNGDFRSNDLSPYRAENGNGRYLTPNPTTTATPADDSSAQISKLENELAQLRLQKKQREAELAELSNLKSGQGRGGQKDIMGQCVLLAMEVKNRESDLKDLRLNLNLLKEETEKQKRDLAQFEEGDELERAPRSKTDLLAQNAKLKEKLDSMNKEFEKRVYDKTLEIERRARAKMHKIAMGIALKHLTEKDAETDYLISEIQKLEKENDSLEQHYHASEMSVMNEASEIN